MADLTITALQVLPDDDATIVNGILGATVIAGQPVYADRDSDDYYPADANASRDTANVVGIALNGGGLGQGVRVQTDGTVILGAGAAPVVGTLYVLSATAGGIAPAADLASGWYRTVLGVGNTNNTLTLGILAFNIVA